MHEHVYQTKEESKKKKNILYSAVQLSRRGIEPLLFWSDNVSLHVARSPLPVVWERWTVLLPARLPSPVTKISISCCTPSSSIRKSLNLLHGWHTHCPVSATSDSSIKSLLQSPSHSIHKTNPSRVGPGSTMISSSREQTSKYDQHALCITRQIDVRGIRTTPPPLSSIWHALHHSIREANTETYIPPRATLKNKNKIK